VAADVANADVLDRAATWRRVALLAVVMARRSGRAAIVAIARGCCGRAIAERTDVLWEA